jgi:cytoskeletal protein CcmA (bactofilin family)
MKRILILTAFLLLSIFVLPAAEAGLFKTGGAVRVDPGEILEENLTAAGERVEMDGTLMGDLVAACRDLRITGDLQGQLIVACQNATVDGTVATDLLIFAQNIAIDTDTIEDLRAACQNLAVKATVRGDLIAGAQFIDIDRGTVIEGDLMVGAAELNLDGEVLGRMVAGAGKIYIEAPVAGDVEVWTDVLEIRGAGQIGGDLTIHYTDNQPEIDESLVAGTVTYEHFEEVEGGSGFWGKFLGFLAAIVTGLLLVLGWKSCLNDELEWADANLGRALLIGFLALIGVPVAAILLMVLVITLPIGATALLVYFPALYFGWITAAIMIGRWLLSLLAKREVSLYLGVLLGVVVLSVVNMIPLVGGLLTFVALLFGFGVLLHGLYKQFRG